MLIIALNAKLCSRLQDENDLILHQKAKHFKCSVCNKRLSSAKALSVHSMQVHKIQVTEISDALAGREDPAWEIFGSQGIPYGMQRGQQPPTQPGAAAMGGAGPPGMMQGGFAPPPYGMPPMMGGPPPYGMPPGRPPYGGAPPPPG